VTDERLRHPSDDRRLTVLQSFRAPSPTSNPYLSLFGDSIRPQVTVLHFSWRTALTARYDLLHVHWPEQLYRGGGSVARRAGVVALFAVLLVRVRALGTVVVQTVHNLQPHEGMSRVERLLARHLDRVTRGWIHHNPYTARDGKDVVADIPHGDYRSWFAGHPRHQVVPGRILYFGQIRRYKGVEELVQAYGAEPGGRTLHVVGKPVDESYAREVAAVAQGTPGVVLRLEHLDDRDLAREITEAQLVVLPYRAMVNSGSVLLTLSLGRPVLVPDTPANRRLQAEVGPRWVLLFESPLDADVLRKALAATASADRDLLPDLSARDWSTTGRSTVHLYRDAVRTARTRRRAPHALTSPTSTHGQAIAP
jgi:beta-1,4-mannosyltransferase